MKECTYHRPKTLREALELSAGEGSARFIAGGTELMLKMRRKVVPSPRQLISLRRVEEMTSVENGDRLRIGASVPLSEVAAHPAIATGFPALHRAIESLGSRQIRNVATMGGNLCNASPCADTAPPLLVYGATVELHGPKGERELPLEELFRDAGLTTLRPGEILTAIWLDPPIPGARSVFLRKGRVKMDLAIASVAARLELDGPRCAAVQLAAGAVAPVPLRLREAEAVLAGSTLDGALLRKAREAAAAEVLPITDLRATAEYRRHLVGVFVERAIRGLLAGTGDPEGNA